jgi:SAM-dependent methyltransferase
MFELTAAQLSGLPRTGPTDPIEFYRRPLVGRLFRDRINLGLHQLPQRRFDTALEVGYGAGAVLFALAPGVDRLYGIDLDANPEVVASALAKRGYQADLARGSVYQMPYEDGFFSLVVSFSVFEHLDRYVDALREVSRVMKPGGYFLLGMPAVNKMMEVGFRMIGFKRIEDHHITTPADVAARFESASLRVMSSRTLDFPLPRPLGVSLYYTWLLEKRA